MERWAEYMTAFANIIDKGFATFAIVNKELIILKAALSTNKQHT
jgi:hypothetical protein